LLPKLLNLISQPLTVVFVSSQIFEVRTSRTGRIDAASIGDRDGISLAPGRKGSRFRLTDSFDTPRRVRLVRCDKTLHPLHRHEGRRVEPLHNHLEHDPPIRSRSLPRCRIHTRLPSLRRSVVASLVNMSRFRRLQQGWHIPVGALRTRHKCPSKRSQTHTLIYDSEWVYSVSLLALVSKSKTRYVLERPQSPFSEASCREALLDERFLTVCFRTALLFIVRFTSSEEPTHASGARGLLIYSSLLWLLKGIEAH